MVIGGIDLGRADIALFADPLRTRVHLPSLMAAPRRRATAAAFVQFEGDEVGPTMFRGLTRSGGFDLTVRYSRRNYPLRVALVHLIDQVAPTAFDSRLLLRTHIEPGRDLPPELQAFAFDGGSVAVGVSEVTETPVNANVVDVSFTATIVQHSFEA